MCVSVCETQNTLGSDETPEWEKRSSLTTTLAKPELPPGDLGPCPSWEAVSGLGRGPDSSPSWDHIVAAQACWAGC